MSSKKKSRQEHDLELPDHDTRSRSRKRTHSPSLDNGMNKYQAGKKKDVYDDRKRHSEREVNDNKKRRIRRDEKFDEFRSGREKRLLEREKGDKEIPRIAYHKDEDESPYSKRKENRDKYRKDLKYEHEKFGECDRYWGKNGSESHSEKRSNDRYWSKYLASEGTSSVQPRYHGDSSQDSQSQRSEYKRLEDKENRRQKDGRSRRNYDSEDVSTDREKNLENGDFVQNISTKHDSKADVNNSSIQQSDVALAHKRTVDLLTSKTGGAYIPPAKLRMMQAQITDKSSAAYQRIAWEALKKSIHGHINKVNTGNIAIIVRELLKENIVRGRGLLCRSIIQAQAASPTFTHVYAALVAVINSKVRFVQQFNVHCELDL
jgi:pre-mRNA-splicing factor CWC22